MGVFLREGLSEGELLGIAVDWRPDLRILLAPSSRQAFEINSLGPRLVRGRAWCRTSALCRVWPFIAGAPALFLLRSLTQESHSLP